MNILLWVLQIVLALVFGAAGTIKISQPREKLATLLGGWVDDVPGWLPRPLGVAELLAAIGLIVPPLVHIAPVLTPLAASGLIVVMIGAVVTHARRREYPNVGINLLLAVMAAVVAWERFGSHAF